MPLKKGGKKAVSYNIKELSHAHPEWPRKKVIAAGINAAKKRKK